MSVRSFPSICVAILVATVAIVPVNKTLGQSATSPVNSTDHDELVPRNLLKLVHAEEVQKELGITGTKIKSLEMLFSKIDPVWFQSRNLKPSDAHAIHRKLEGQLWAWAKQNLDSETQRRLWQIELRSQGVRMLLRDDIGKQIGVSSSQKSKLASLATSTDKAKLEYTKGQYSSTGATKEQQQAVVDALQAENKYLAANVRPEQMQKLQSVLGSPFDTGSLKRIYPMAPEFADVEHWINSEPLTLKELRGNVVLVHFYAFQCHNCHANFDIYKKWHDELRSKGVRVVGIQSPETRREADPVAVREAAKETGLDFPIIVDLKKDNWKNWGNTMWPTVYVIDQDGYIRHWQMGELQWKGARYDQDVERVVDELLQSS